MKGPGSVMFLPGKGVPVNGRGSRRPLVRASSGRIRDNQISL